MFWLFDDIVSKRNDIYQNYYGTHPYYKTIYGKKAGEYINLATSISLLFPQIYFIPVDTQYPESEKYFNEYRYYNKEFGMITDFSWVLENQNKFEIIPLLKEDKVVKNILWKIPKQSIDLILQNAILEYSVSVKEQIPIYAGPSQIEILKKIGIILQKEPILSSNIEKSLDQVIKTYGVAYNIENSSDYLELRCNKDLIRYGNTLRQSMINEQFDEEQILENILKIYASEENRKKINGILKIANYPISLISMIPPVGAALGTISIVKDVVNDSSQFISNRKTAMYHFTAELQKEMTIKKIEKRLKKIRVT